LDSGRYIFTNDISGPDVAKLPEFEVLEPNPHTNPEHYVYPNKKKLGQIYVSDDRGHTWQRKAVRSFCHARPFAFGNTVYVLGQVGDLVIYCSHDGGETWDDGQYLTENEIWHQSACNVWIENNIVTLVMECRFWEEGEQHLYHDWSVCQLAPVVMRGDLRTDLTRRENWTFSNALRFKDVIDENQLEYFGVPFMHTHNLPAAEGTFQTHNLGWLESNIVRITDPDHVWYDPAGNTFHIFMRAHTAGTGYCAMMKAVISEENGKEIITVQPETAPSGRKIVFLPMPGGQMRFHILWDAQTKLFWLLSTQAVDSMVRMDRLPEDRYNIPCDERRRMQLSFSKNLVDWCFAGLVSMGASEKQSRHYAAMAIDGDDLLVVSRSGDACAATPHDTNLATFHRIENFRTLVY